MGKVYLMCKYCDEKSYDLKVYQNCFGVWLLDIERLGLEYQDSDQNGIEIHYCPWCGRRLD